MLRVKISSSKNKKSSVQLIQESRKFFDTEIYPFLSGEDATTKYMYFLKDELKKLRQHLGYE